MTYVPNKPGEIRKKVTEDIAATAKFSQLHVRDFKDVACPKRVQYAERYITRANDARHHLKHINDRLTNKLRAVAAYDHPGQTVTINEIVDAQDAITGATRRLDHVIRSARTVRNWARRSCRIRR